MRNGDASGPRQQPPPDSASVPKQPPSVGLPFWTKKNPGVVDATVAIQRNQENSWREVGSAFAKVVAGVAATVGTTCAAVWILMSVAGSPTDPEPILPNRMKDVKACHQKNTKGAAGDVVVHKEAIDSILRELEESDTSNTIIVRGPRNSGKTWTTLRALSMFDEKFPGRLRVVWIKAGGIGTVAKLADDVDAALGLSWDKGGTSIAVLEGFAPKMAESRMQNSPRTDEQRLEKSLDLLKRRVRRKCNKETGRDSPTKWVVLLDDFEAQRPCDPALNAAFRTVAMTLTRHAKDCTLQPIVVSSDPRIMDYFKQIQHTESIMVEWLDGKELKDYVSGFLRDTKHDPDEIAKKVAATVGTLAFHVRKACKAIKAVEPAKVQNRLDDLRGQFVTDDFDILNDAVKLERNEGSLLELLEMWQPWAGAASNTQITLSADEQDALSLSQDRALAVILDAGLAYKDSAGCVKATSLPATLAMQRLRNRIRRQSSARRQVPENEPLTQAVGH